MNILVCLFAMLMVGWFTHEMFVVQSEPILGFASLILFVWLIPMSWVAVEQDRAIFGR